MGATECQACGNRVNVAVAVCPHCGAKRTTATIADTKLSKDEIRALLVTSDEPQGDEGRGLAAIMFLPHDQTRGGARNAELALTLIAAPLVIAGVAVLGLSLRRARRRVVTRPTGEITAALVMTGVGGSALWPVLDLLHAPALPLVGISVVAVWVRAIIRLRAATARSRELVQLAPAEPAKPEQPDKAPDVQPGDQPRFLR